MTDEERLRMRSVPLIENRSQLRSRGIKYLDRLIAGSTYRDNSVLRSAMWAFKFRRQWRLAPDLAEVLIERIPKTLSSDAVLVPVPLHVSRLITRGFNQAALLAKEVSAHTHLPHRTLLRRVLPTGHQSRRTKQERLCMLRYTFRAMKASKKYAHVILVDDLSTTGMTLDMCAKELKKHGVQCVEGWVVAHD